MKMQMKNNNTGITLIALIITIIVMLILVAVTVSISIDGNLFGRAEDAVYKTNQKVGKLQNDVDFYTEKLNELANNNTNDNQPNANPLKIGDYVAYTPDIAPNYTKIGLSESGYWDSPTEGIPQDTTLTWRILSINNDGSIDIVSSAPTETTLYLHGQNGFNNGVYLLNDLCANLYSNTELGVTARSINLIDIESKMNSTGTAARNAYNNGNKTYGEIQTYTENSTRTPDIYKHVGKTIEEESKAYYTAPTTLGFTVETSLEVQQTYYSFNNTPTNYFDNSIFYELVFGTNTNYALATRFANCDSEDVKFGLRSVNSTALDACNLLPSKINPSSLSGGSLHIRPVVTLGANIQISETGGTADNPRTLSK